MVSSRRSGKKLTVHELGRLLDLLAQTGNFALACHQLGRAKSGLYKRRQRDSLFDCQCTAALALARIPGMVSEGRGRGRGRGAGFALSAYRGRPQLRRAAPGPMARRGTIEQFLRALAATGNIRFSARSIGVAASSIHDRARRDPVFASDIAAALHIARDCLEMNLIESSGVSSDWSLASSPSVGEGWGAEAMRDSPDPDPAGNFASRMTISQALALLGRLDRRVDRDRDQAKRRST